MPKYECRTCKNSFVQAASANRQCPACGSNNIGEVYEYQQQRGTFLQDYLGVIISGVVVLLMLIVLFLLPYVPAKYLASLQNKPEACGISVNVTIYGYPPDDTARFSYSFDGGKVFSESRFIDAKTAGKYEIKVQSIQGDKDTIIYAFTNPYDVKPDPSCIQAPADPCDCKNLKIENVVKEMVNGRMALVVQAGPKDCNLEYSISGINGKYQKENVFFIFQPTDSVFIRSDKCAPVGYINNPFVAKPAAAPPVAQPRTEPGVYLYSQVDSKPYPSDLGQTLYDLEQHFQKKLSSSAPYSGFSITFDVNSMGEVVNKKFSSGVSGSVQGAVNSIFQELGNWTPGDKNGSFVTTRITLRIPER